MTSTRRFYTMEIINYLIWQHFRLSINEKPSDSDFYYNVKVTNDFVLNKFKSYYNKLKYAIPWVDE